MRVYRLLLIDHVRPWRHESAPRSSRHQGLANRLASASRGQACLASEFHGAPRRSPELLRHAKGMEEMNTTGKKEERKGDSNDLRLRYDLRSSKMNDF